MKGCGTIAGFFIGLAAGTVQFLLLARFSRGITYGKYSPRTMLFGIVQFLLPFVVLIVCALVIPGDLIWASGGLVAALFGGVGINAIRGRAKRGNTERGDGGGEE